MKQVQVVFGLILLGLLVWIIYQKLKTENVKEKIKSAMDTFGVTTGGILSASENTSQDISQNISSQNISSQNISSQNTTNPEQKIEPHVTTNEYNETQTNPSNETQSNQ